MRINSTLNEYLRNFYNDVQETFDLFIKRITEAENVTEELKVTDQLEWLRRMNNICNRVEEFVLKDFVYQ